MASMPSFLLIVVATSISLAQSQLIGSTPWDTLQTNFPKFIPVPLNQSAAINEGWTSIMNCGDAGSPGNLYANNTDFAAMPFYNADGQIAGIILGMKDPGAYAHTAPYVFYQKGNLTFWGIEANFRDPDTICTAGSTKDISFGDRLWFANGSHASYSQIPLNESSEYLNREGWSLGACKDSAFRMGTHWWRYLSVDGDCNTAYPLFVLYDDGILHAWGVAMGNEDRPFLNSTRWEHPAGATLTSFFLDGEAPTCLAQQGKLYNSQHVYMTSSVLKETTSCTAAVTTTMSSNDDDREEDEGMKPGYIVLIVLCALLVIAASMVLIKYACIKIKGKDSKGRGLLNEETSYQNMDQI